MKIMTKAIMQPHFSGTKQAQNTFTPSKQPESTTCQGFPIFDPFNAIRLGR